MTLKVSPMQAFVRRLPIPLYLASEVHRGLGIPLETLRMWGQRSDIPGGPSFKALYRGKWISLYTESDVNALREYRDSRYGARPAMHVGGPGRPPMWSDQEKAVRNRKNNQSNYYRRRARLLQSRGDTAGALDADAKADSIRMDLTQQAKQRRAELARRIF